MPTASEIISRLNKLPLSSPAAQKGIRRTKRATRSARQRKSTRSRNRLTPGRLRALRARQKRQQQQQMKTIKDIPQPEMGITLIPEVKAPGSVSLEKQVQIVPIAPTPLAAITRLAQISPAAATMATEKLVSKGGVSQQDYTKAAQYAEAKLRQDNAGLLETIFYEHLPGPSALQTDKAQQYMREYLTNQPKAPRSITQAAIRTAAVSPAAQKAYKNIIQVQPGVDFLGTTIQPGYVTAQKKYTAAQAKKAAEGYGAQRNVGIVAEVGSFVVTSSIAEMIGRKTALQTSRALRSRGLQKIGGKPTPRLHALDKPFTSTPRGVTSHIATSSAAATLKGGMYEGGIQAATRTQRKQGKIDIPAMGIEAALGGATAVALGVPIATLAAARKPIGRAGGKALLGAAYIADPLEPFGDILGGRALARSGFKGLRVTTVDVIPGSPSTTVSETQRTKKKQKTKLKTKKGKGKGKAKPQPRPKGKSIILDTIFNPEAGIPQKTKTVTRKATVVKAPQPQTQPSTTYTPNTALSTALTPTDVTNLNVMQNVFNPTAQPIGIPTTPTVPTTPTTPTTTDTTTTTTTPTTLSTTTPIPIVTPQTPFMPPLVPGSLGGGGKGGQGGPVFYHDELAASKKALSKLLLG